MKATDVKIEVLKNKLTANFSHYVSGNLYYTVLLDSGLYQFPIATVEEGPTFNDDESGLSMYDIESVQLSSDLGTTSFDAEVKASLLNRWIGIAIDNKEFIKID